MRIKAAGCIRCLETAKLLQPRCTHRTLLCSFQAQLVDDSASLTGSICVPPPRCPGGKDTHVKSAKERQSHS